MALFDRSLASRVVLLMAMEHLPFTIAHSAWFPWALIAGLTGAHLLWTWIRPRLLARLRARSQRARVGEPGALESAAGGEQTTLTGTLGLAGAPAKRFEDGQPSAATTASPVNPAQVLGALAITRCGEGLTLDVGGIDVGIEGDLEVLVGSREVYFGSSFRRIGGALSRELDAADSAALNALSDYQAAFRSLLSGDQVRISGYLRRLPAPAGGEGYRMPGDRWVISATPDAGSSDVSERTISAAYEGNPRVSLPRGWRVVRSLVVAAVFWLALFGAASYTIRYWGADTFLSPWEPPAHDHYRSCRSAGFRVEAHFAFSLPFYRESRLARVTKGFESRCHWDRGATAQLAALYELQGSCAEEAGALLNHGERRAGEQKALECVRERGDAGAARLVALTGRFDEASAAWPELSGSRFEASDHQVEAIAHLLAGRPERASVALKQLAAGGYSRELVWGGPGGGRRVTSRLHDMSCLAAAIAVSGIDEEEAEGAAGRVLGSSPECFAFHVATLEGRERNEMLRETVRGEGPGAWEALMLLTADDPDLLDRLHYGFVGWVLGRLPSDLLRPAPADEFSGLELAALSVLDGREQLSTRLTVLRAELRARAASFELTMGELEAAVRHARGVVEDLERLAPLEDRESARFSWYQRAVGRQAIHEMLMGDFDGARTTSSHLESVGGAVVVHTGSRVVLTDQTRYESVNTTETLDLPTRLEAVRGFLERGDASTLFVMECVPQLGLGFWIASAEGNGEALARRLDGRQAPIRSRLNPFWIGEITSGRGELLEQSHWGSRAGNEREGLYPALVEAAWDRQVARQLDDDEWAEEAESGYTRLRQAYLRHDVALWLRLIRTSAPRHSSY